MSLDLQTRTSQHRLNSRPVWDPPVRGIVRVTLFNEIHRGKIALFKNTGVPEGIIFSPFAGFRRTSNHGLEHQLSGNFFNQVVEGHKWISQLVKNSHEEDVVELPC